MSELSDLVRDILTGTGGDPWDALAEVGLTNVGVPEEAGGSGGTLDDLAEVVRAVAAHGGRVPLPEHATAAWALAPSGTAPQLGTVALVPSLSPRKRLQLTVPWAARASHLVVAPLDGGPSAVVDTRAGGILVTAGADAAGGSLDDVDVPADAVVPAEGTDGRTVAARLALLRSAAIVGAAETAYALTRGHVRTREQFGRPLIRLPAVATSLARLRVEVLQAQTALDGALTHAEDGRALSSAAAARVTCGEVATEAARIAHQLHGAIGITEEYALHRSTRALWALRDADLPEHDWAVLLGGLALDGGEEQLWDDLTAVGRGPDRAA